MENRREFEFEMPVGYMDEDGRLHRTAVLRKMTGRDEAIIADKRNRNSAARMITELLASCVLKIGSLDRPGAKVVQALYSADRHFLLLRLREVTFGPEMQGNYSCPTCHSASTLLEDLSALEVVKLEEGESLEDIVVSLEDGYLDRDGTTYEQFVFRHATGADEERIAAISRENASNGRNALMARCLKAVGDMPRNRVEALGTAIFSDLTLKDRGLIEKALNNGGPGIKMRRDILCHHCGRQYAATLDFSNFLALS